MTLKNHLSHYIATSECKKMITTKENQRVTSLLILYMIGYDLEKVGTSKDRLLKDYASKLNRPKGEVKLPEIKKIKA